MSHKSLYLPIGPKEASETAISAKIPFEITVAAEKFISEASSYTSVVLSELDVCHHKVISKLYF